MYMISRKTFRPEVSHPGFFRHKEEIGNPVCENPIDLFRHAAVERTQSGFNMGNQWLRLWRQLGRNQRACKRGVHIANYQHGVRLLCHQDRLEALHHLSRLLRMGSRASAQKNIRLGHIQVGKKRV